jgi:hypothetical protein
MPDIDYDRLGEEIAKHLHANCPFGWEAEDVATLREFAQAIRKAKGSAVAVSVWVLISAGATVFVLGIVEWIKRQLASGS